MRLGEENVWELMTPDNMRRTEFSLDTLCEYLCDYLYNDSEDESTAAARYEKYLQVLMDLEFGALIC